MIAAGLLRTEGGAGGMWFHSQNRRPVMPTANILVRALTPFP